MDKTRTMALSFLLLKDREAFWKRVRAQDLRWVDLIGLAVLIVIACAVYSVVLAGWRSPQLILYVAIKLPVLFLGTTSLVAGFNWMTSSLLGSGLSFKSTVFAVFGAMAISGWILLSLAPVALFFLMSGVPVAGSHDELRTAHNAILITHIIILSLAGFGGNVVLLKGLRRVVRPHCSADLLFALWVIAFAFVGCQLSWILRPFVGSPFYPVAWLRPDCLDRNFYEFVFTEVMPYLLTGAK